MKKNIYIVLVALIVFVLTACQAAPTESPAVDFFKEDAARWISVKAPAGWLAKQPANASNQSIIVTNDWEGYQKPGSETVGIVIVPMTDKGPAVQVLQVAIGRFKKLLTNPTGQVALVEANGQSYASIEYQGKSIQEDSQLAYYFLTVISNGERNVLVFTSVSPKDEIGVKPTYQSIVKGITVH